MAKSLKFLQDFIISQGGTVAPDDVISELQSIPTQIVRPDLGQALETQEPYKIEYDPHTDSSISELNYFEDGIQRTLLIGYILYENFHIPIHFSTVASVILKRENKQLKVWKSPLIKKMLIMPQQFIVKPEAINYLPSDISLVDISVSSPDYYEIKRLAFQAAKSERLKCEEELIGNWIQSANPDDLLIIDGTIMNFRNEDALEKCVGISKSFQNIYCPLGDYQKILKMQEYERSWSFRFKEEGDDPKMGARDRISWYLRLRDPKQHNPEFSMVRVEVSLRHEQKIVDIANRISKSILSERYPASFPDTRWHNLLYPIKRCEDYLRSVLPSMETVRASVGRY